MICPNCQASLLHRERSGNVCGRCRRRFALEPKAAPLGLHDVRIGKLADKLSQGGRLRYTTTQLRYAAARGRLPKLLRVRSRIIATIVPFAFIVCLMSGIILGWKALLGVVAVLVALLLSVFALTPLIRRAARVGMPVSAGRWETEVLTPWAAVYRALPPGAVDERRITIGRVPQPRIAVVCPEQSVLACLAANRVAQNHDAALVHAPDQAPRGVPVLVLHDASLGGLDLVDESRMIHGNNVIDVGLAPRSVMDAKGAILLRDRRPSGAARKYLRTRQQLTDAERLWLSDGWWSPIAAVPPARLLAAVERAVTRVQDAADPDRREARLVGFLSWPSRQ